ncbi:MAG: hypothetical protein Ct9H300mP20_22030 [Gammaproteobacteria bacterium]|nr:MAG: hypothetical protein Ct9H300mP20_22030 [Gammaproteobacteria bacterium]
MLAKVKSEYGVPLISDVHSPEEVLKAKEVVMYYKSLHFYVDRQI